MFRLQFIFRMQSIFRLQFILVEKSAQLEYQLLTTSKAPLCKVHSTHLSPFPKSSRPSWWSQSSLPHPLWWSSPRKEHELWMLPRPGCGFYNCFGCFSHICEQPGCTELNNNTTGWKMFLSFLSDPGKPGVRSLGPDVRPSVCPYTLLRLNWCDSGWWRYQVNTNW